MIRKEMLLFIGIFLIIIFGNALVSGICCEKLKNTADGWCQVATEKSQCNATYSIWEYKQTCQTVRECNGTCIHENTGECSQYVDKRNCQESGGKWNESAIEKIDACQRVCCLLGKDAWFLNPTACTKLFTQKGIQGEMRDDIKSRGDCELLRSNIKTGACVISTLTEKACRVLTSSQCTKEKINELAQYLKQPSGRSDIDVKFWNGLLCTASDGNGKPISDCGKSSNTECKDNKVYFKDLCGNFANIYNSTMFTESTATGAWKPAMIEYWTHIIDPYYSYETCNVTSAGSNSCGNCDPAENTVCRDYGETDLPKPQNNANGLVCGDLSCTYKDKSGKTRTYQNGESWCAGTPGTFNIVYNLTTSVIFVSNRTTLENVDKYNIPGSRYYKLICSNGEVTVEECGDYRSGVCMEGVDDNTKKTDAFCIYNNWRTCFELDTKTSCENNKSLCKWIPGYRWDEQIVSEDKRKEMQGSCVPLVAPGFDFWKPTSQGNAICGMGNVQDAALFETNWYSKKERKSLSGGSTLDSWPFKDLANNCVNGCYTIPRYGQQFDMAAGEEKVYPEDISAPKTNYQILTLFYDKSGAPLPKDVSSYLLSARKGQYCNKDGKPDQWLTGPVRKNFYDCTPVAGSDAKNDRKTRAYPIYLTNDEWINSITERARSLGDCGYKMGVSGKYSAPETEMITAIFQKMTQKGAVKKNVTVEQIIYKGGAFLTGDLEKYETTLSTVSKSYSCGDRKGVCRSTVNNPEPCIADEGGTLLEAVEGETTPLCPEKSVCCVYEDLGALDE